MFSDRTIDIVFVIYMFVSSQSFFIVSDRRTESEGSRDRQSAYISHYTEACRICFFAE